LGTPAQSSGPLPLKPCAQITSSPFQSFGTSIWYAAPDSWPKSTREIGGSPASGDGVGSNGATRVAQLSV
jgi:hypothetical protein